MPGRRRINLNRLISRLLVWLLAICLFVLPAMARQASELLAALENKYSIEIELAEPLQASWLQVRYTPLSSDEIVSQDVRDYLLLFAQELNKYPVGLIRTANLQQIALVKELSYDEQPRAALPDFLKEILYLDVFRGAKNRLYQRHVVHHEFYHLLEEEVFHDPYYKDPAWAALNPAGFRYGSGGAAAQKGPQYKLSHPRLGFINLYSTSGLEEDKAEIFAALMLPEEARLLTAWSRSDPFLAAKLAAMKASLKLKVPEMDEAWWNHPDSPETGAPRG